MIQTDHIRDVSVFFKPNEIFFRNVVIKEPVIEWMAFNDLATQEIPGKPAAWVLDVTVVVVVFSGRGCYKRIMVIEKRARGGVYRDHLIESDALSE
jgi:hypothetical protein